MAVGVADGVADAFGDAVCVLLFPEVGTIVMLAEGCDVACVLPVAAALAEGLGESAGTGRESNTTPHTLQVLCSVPI